MISRKLTLLVSFLCVQNLVYAKNILYIGDSQSYGAMGTYLAQNLEQQDSQCQNQTATANQVTHLAVSGSSPRHWSDRNYRSQLGKWLCESTMKQYQSGQTQHKSKTNPYCKKAKQKKQSVLEEAISQHQPDMLVFQFLGNDTWFFQQANKLPAEKQEPYLRKSVYAHLKLLLSQVENRECLFITSNPPHESKAGPNQLRLAMQEKYIAYIHEINPNCTVIDGNNEETQRTIASSTANYTSDRLHMNDSGGRLFADYAIQRSCHSQSNAVEQFLTTQMPSLGTIERPGCHLP